VNRRECLHEADVFHLVWTRQWPTRAEADLRAHVASCPICSDLVTVSVAIGELDDSALPIKLPDAGTAWYNAARRARQESAARAARPVLLAELAALACGLTGAVIAWREIGPSSFDRLLELPWAALLALRWPSFASLTALPAFPWMAGVALAWALLVPAALYIARLTDRSSEQPTDRS
jgi:hypothetical protein